MAGWPAPPPTSSPMVAVPWPTPSQGSSVQVPVASNQDRSTRREADRAEWSPSTPVSMVATTTPSPVVPALHAAGAPVAATDQVGSSAAGAATVRGECSTGRPATSGTTRVTPGSASRARPSAAVPSTDSALATQWEMTETPASSARATAAACATRAWSRRAPTTAAPRAVRPVVAAGPARSGRPSKNTR